MSLLNILPSTNKFDDKDCFHQLFIALCLLEPMTPDELVNIVDDIGVVYGGDERICVWVHLIVAPRMTDVDVLEHLSRDLTHGAQHEQVAVRRLSCVSPPSQIG